MSERQGYTLISNENRTAEQCSSIVVNWPLGELFRVIWLGLVIITNLTITHKRLAEYGSHA